MEFEKCTIMSGFCRSGHKYLFLAPKFPSVQYCYCENMKWKCVLYDFSVQGHFESTSNR